MTGCGGTMGRHDWIISAMVNMAGYAERHGLKQLHQQLCHALAAALTGELAGNPSYAQREAPPAVANVLPFDGIRQQSS